MPKCKDCKMDEHIDEPHAPSLCISVLKNTVKDLMERNRVLSRAVEQHQETISKETAHFFQKCPCYENSK